MLLHHGQMYGIPRREMLVSEDNLLRPFDDTEFHREDFIDCVEKSIESRLNVMSAIDRGIPVQNFL